MEIFTNMTFWIIVIAIVIILAIIGYVAEGTVLSNKTKKEVKPVNEEQDSTWTNNTSNDVETKQETVYKTADQNWMDMPSVDTVSIPNEEPVQVPVEPMPTAAPVQVPAEPIPMAAPVQVPVEPMPMEAPVQVPVEPMPMATPVQVPVEPMSMEASVQVPVEPGQMPVNSSPVNENVENQNVWTN